MKHIIFKENTKYKLALLIKENALDINELKKYYINKTTISPEDIIGFSLDYNKSDKAPATYAKNYLGNLLKALDNLGTTTLLVCDSTYFKYLTGLRKVTGAHGYVHPCNIEGFEHMNVILGFNYKGLFYNPTSVKHIDLSLRTTEAHLEGSYKEIGSDIIHSSSYPTGTPQIASKLASLHKYPMLFCDIEAHSLKFYETDIGTIGFAWDKHNGIAFSTYADHTDKSINPDYHKQVNKLLREFFDSYKGTLVFHNGNYDLKLIINSLYMDDFLDQDGLIEGINNFRNQIHDTKLISYLATNTTAGNELGLKTLAHEFAGNYAVDVEDITTVPEQELLEYNLIDCLSTAYIFEKNYPIMLEDNQKAVYEDIFIPSVHTILQMELTGIPIDMNKVNEVEKELNEIQVNSLNTILNYDCIEQTEDILLDKYLEKDFNDRKNKAKNPDRIKPKIKEEHSINFNINSTKQLGTLLHDVLELPIIDTTDTGLPSVGAKTLKKHFNLTKDKDIKNILNTIVEYSEVTKILSTFITAFKINSIKKSDGVYYLHGNYNLGGTVSGRMSSSNPNLQNIPSNSLYAKLIKECFIAPKGWLMCGADFDSLEDRVSALTTKDRNKLKVYEQGYDGHSLRAYTYFKDQMPDIENTVESINSIETRYPELRQHSKGPTFLLTYGGTNYGLQAQIGLPKKEAINIEEQYHELYKESDEWVQARLQEASSTGYIEGAFGLRVRTPILKQTMINKESTPYEAQSESRTAGNALGQSYGLLNNRAANEFQERVLNSSYKNDIKPIMQIHDSMYFIVRNKIGVVHWLNVNLPDCMSWDKLSELRHETVKLSGSVEIFYPNWANKIKLPNNISKQEILSICKKL